MDIMGTDKLIDELDDIEIDYNNDNNKVKMALRYILSYGKYALRCLTLGFALGTVFQFGCKLVNSKLNK